MALPIPKTRGGVWVANLRRYGGSDKHALGLPASAPMWEAGAAMQRKIDELEVSCRVRAPLLPGLERPGLRLSELVALYEEARAGDFERKGGESYVRDYCKYIRTGLGHLTVEDLAGKLGSAALRAWRDQLRARGWGPRAIRNALNMALAILTWGQDEGRELTGPLPRKPKHGMLPEPIFHTLPEADFRLLREHLFDEGLRWGTVKRWAAADGCTPADYVARRQLMMSAGFYLGTHPEDANSLLGAYLSVDVGRYERRNTKSSRVVRPDVFDMPEQFRIDCEDELARRGIPRFPPDEPIIGPRPWRQSSRVLADGCARLFPDGPRRYASFQVLRRSCIWEYTVRGWRTHEIAALVGHVDETMIRTVYRRCTQLGLISPVRVAWTVHSGPHGHPTETGKVLAFA